MNRLLSHEQDAKLPALLRAVMAVTAFAALHLVMLPHRAAYHAPAQETGVENTDNSGGVDQLKMSDFGGVALNGAGK